MKIENDFLENSAFKALDVDSLKAMGFVPDCNANDITSCQAYTRKIGNFTISIIFDPMDSNDDVPDNFEEEDAFKTSAIWRIMVFENLPEKDEFGFDSRVLCTVDIPHEDASDYNSLMKNIADAFNCIKNKYPEKENDVDIALDAIKNIDSPYLKSYMSKLNS